MTRIVLDSNIYVSAFVFGGNPAAVLQQAEDSIFTLLISPALKQEVEEVLARKFRWPATLIRAACMPIWKQSLLIVPELNIDECRDSDDNRVLECAFEGNADYIITGDFDLLKMKIFRGIKIISPAGFLQLP